ncbi:GrpB family protein [Hymenobacter sp. IS2118]|uniref:GrpB family protein n=1 Tax=Hymenobacter sp. IS2118 TaxID=1505605 RepID=UPI000906FFF1
MVLKKYTSDWIGNFTNIKCEIETVLSGIHCLIEHVGSTSVPQLDSKPVIDIDVIYYDPSDFEIIKSQLEGLGYYHNGNQGIQGRDVFKRDGCNSNCR